MKKQERAIIVVLDQNRSGDYLERTVQELNLLADTAGALVLDQIIQKKDSPDKAYYIGKGKAEELDALVQLREADLVIFNDELSPTQIRNLDRILSVKVIDRTALILDIFARRALSREGMLQVELAQMHYLLPRLTGLGNQLSRLGGGIGTRGPGETQLEADRRIIRRRINNLRSEIKSLKKQRMLHRERRKRNRCSVISLVGYTNAGKSTLINTLTGSDLYTENKFFATLDPIVRRGYIDGCGEVLYTDTVGFIEKLPQQLITAFEATLEEISAADILLHVVDISHPDFAYQIQVVREHLSKIDPEYYRHEMLVFNKTDLLRECAERKQLTRDFPDASFVSALKREGLDSLKNVIADYFRKQRSRIKILLPYSASKIYADLKESGEIESLEYKPECLSITAVVSSEMAAKLKRYTV